ncbi:uncharacterized protein LOC133814510 [Humulus lupulus]|uniref:uncharacterized protein LOC133814510 n=1 Tax=Humulus lupulus TaxID=3486 RepID=UPI002B40E2AF|nr:uncharacterized protein LOC133814510 [Humulus lupulus]
MSWNVRGLNKLNKQKMVMEVCRMNKVGIVTLLETKIKGAKIKEIMSSTFFGWDFYSSEAVEGRILVIWRSNLVQLAVLQESDQFLHCQVRFSNKTDLCLTFVYGSNSLEIRKILWNDLSQLICPSKAWMILGDFNVVFTLKDRLGGRPITVKEMDDARQWYDLGLVEEMKIMGPFYTWSNNQEGESRIFSKLDRVFINDTWLEQFPSVTAYSQWEIGSDHSLILIKHMPALRVGVQPFRFYNMWITHPQFRIKVLSSWKQSLRFKGRGLDQICWKLTRLKHILKKFNWKAMGDVACNYERSKHLRKRKLANRIVSFVTAEGQIVDDYDKVTAHFLQHFKSFLGTPSHATGVIDIQAIRFGSVLNSDAQLNLIKPFTVKEVKATMFSIHSLKSPGPDGYGAGFLKALWKDIGKEIALAVLEFFETSSIPQPLNNTLLSLIPKVTQPMTASDFRPIACCNTIYKCISKMLCNRLNLVVPLLINQNQGAFVKNHFLAHNVLILQDLLKDYNRKNCSPRYLMKIDISKAYDSIDWDFLENLLNAFCFPKRFIRWIMASKEKEFKFHPLCKSLNLVSLYFADDLLLFSKATPNSIKILQQVFTDFTKASGLSINHSKSKIFVGGISAGDKQSLLQISNLSEGQFPLNYLGVPLRPTKWRAIDCEIIIDKMRSRLSGWANCHLSYVGRVQLINSVLMGIRAYWMHIFLLPQKVVKAIDCLCRKFLWGEKNNRSKFHRVSWDLVCKPKCCGGLGFKDSASWNKLMLAKFIWAVSSKQDMLWVKWINCIYLKGSSIWDYLLKHDTSWYWRKIVNFCQFLSKSVLETAVRNGKLQLGRLYSVVFPSSLVHYDKTVWCRLSAPKHQFILWLAVNQKLPTRDWLNYCHIPLTSLNCPVCFQAEESHSHLFFDCIFSRKVIHSVQEWLRGFAWPVQFQNWITWLSLPQSSWFSKVITAACAASVYLIWMNRNKCWIEKSCIPVHRIDQLIRFSIKVRIMNLVGCNCSPREKQMLHFVSLL